LAVVFCQPRVREVPKEDLLRIEELRQKIQSMEGSIQETDLNDLKNELNDLEIKSREEKIIETTGFESRSSLLWRNLKYVGWSFLNVIWWLVSFNGILALLTIPVRSTELIFNEISIQTNKIYKSFMDAMIKNVDESQKKSITSNLKRYLSVLMGVLWSSFYPVLVAGLSFVFMLKRSLFAFIGTLVGLAILKIILPVPTSYYLFWYLWRCLEVVSFFSTSFILARPPPQTSKVDVKKKKVK